MCSAVRDCAISFRAFLVLFAQECEDESKGDGMRRERSLLLLTGLAANALDEVYGVSKVRVIYHMRCHGS